VSLNASESIDIAVVGAHLSGMPLNGELQNLAGRLLRETATAPDYRLLRLAERYRRSPICYVWRRVAESKFQ
jgi:allophanate hydrolase